ncbi:MAG: hypothetical protein WCZ08_02050 [Parcubacteria group bacterium]
MSVKKFYSEARGTLAEKASRNLASTKHVRSHAARLGELWPTACRLKALAVEHGAQFLSSTFFAVKENGENNPILPPRLSGCGFFLSIFFSGKENRLDLSEIAASLA